MICKVCKNEFDDRFTKCPYCGNTVQRNAEQQQYPQYRQPVKGTQKSGIRLEDEYDINTNGKDEYRDISSGRTKSGASVFDEEEYEDNADAYEEEYDGAAAPARGSKFKFIVGGIAIGVIVFSIGLCVLYFTGAIGGKSSDETSETVSTSEDATPLASTTDATTEATTATTQATTQGTTVPQSTELDDNGNPLPDVYFDTPETLTITASGGLNLRKGPGTTYGKVKLLASKTQVMAVGKSVTISDWLYVYYEKDKTYGWASVKYLDGADSLSSSSKEDSTTEPETTAAVTTTEPTTKATTTETTKANKDAVSPEKKYDSKITYYVAANSGLNLRKGPGSDSDKVAVLNKNTEVTAVGYNSDNTDWVYVYCSSSGQYGWLSIKYLSEQKQ